MPGIPDDAVDSRSAICVTYALEEPPGVLIDALLARGVDVRLADDPYLALASLIEASPGLAGVPAVVLLLVEPAQLPLVGALADVVWSQLPRTVLWRHAASEPQPLAAFTPADRAALRHGPARAEASVGEAGVWRHDSPRDLGGVLSESSVPGLRLSRGQSPGMRARHTSLAADSPVRVGEDRVSGDELSSLLGATDRQRASGHGT